MGIRSFLAFELPKKIEEIITRTSLEMRHYGLDVRWVRPANIHLTIVFMGDVDPDRLAAIEAALDPVCRGQSPFRVALKGTGVFPNRRRPNVIWIGLAGDMEKMSQFRNALQDQLAPFGIQKEARAFKPHLTLGRFRRGSAPGGGLEPALSRFADLESPVCALKGMTLFRSDLKPEGPIYTRLKQWALQGATQNP
jgi:RNA 2',3'-cyclic 3'-phosphodiesterase